MVSATVVGSTKITIQQESFDVGQVNERLREASARVGAVATFVGVCRDLNEGDTVSEMWLEHYPGMTEKSIAGIVERARERFQIMDCEVVHRVGRLEPRDPIVLVAVSSSHRGDAFAACEFIMDFLKTQAPFWKKESTGKGERWVDARVSDDAARERWQR